MGSIEAIPTVDISAWIDTSSTEEERQRAVDEMRNACTRYGFFNLIAHGVSPQAQSQALNCAKLFFTLSEQEKMEVCISKSVGRSFRGYEPPGIQVHQEGLLPDTKECFIIGHEVPEHDPECGTFSTGPNLWPKSLPEDEFRIPIMEYQARMVALVKVLLKILARGLPKEWNCSPDVLDPLGENNPSIPMRLLHYGPQPIRDDRQFGVGDHTDFGCVTILLQDMGTEGLEVWYPPTETWIPVPPQENAYVINVGDMLQKFTGGYYRSARHRVVTFTANHRYSVPFFLNGQLKLKCKTLDGSGTETIVAEHIRGRLLETMGKAGEKLK